jgi:RNA polymerase sigma-70 factor (ECF subfamily)
MALDAMDNPVNTLSDADLVRRILAGEHDLYEVIIRRYNQRMYRVTRSIVQHQDEAEDVVQDTYARAFEHLSQFEGRALLSTWLTRIAVNEARNRMKQHSRYKAIDSTLSKAPELGRTTQTPEHERLAEETRAILENAIDGLPEAYRSVFVMRSVEDMSTSETAHCPDISERTVKIRLLRARSMLRRMLYEKVHAASAEAFQFLGERCDRLTANVLRRIAIRSQGGSDGQTGRSGGSPALPIRFRQT